MVRPGRVLAIILVILVIASATRSRRHVEAPDDPTARLTMSADVPAPVMAMLRRACFDCHSEETRWPWYSALPVASWLIEHDVEAGRRRINFSRWAEYNPFDRADKLDKMCEMAASRTMPLRPYRLLHPEARLSDAAVDELCAWTGQEASRLVQGGS